MASCLRTRSSLIVGLAWRTTCIHTDRNMSMYAASAACGSCVRKEMYKWNVEAHCMPAYASPSHKLSAMKYSKKACDEGKVFDDDAFYADDILPYSEVTMATNKAAKTGKVAVKTKPVQLDKPSRGTESQVQSSKKQVVTSKPRPSNQLRSGKVQENTKAGSSKVKNKTGQSTNKQDKVVPNTNKETGSKAHGNETSNRDSGISELDTSGFDSVLLFPLFQATDPEAPTFQPVTEPSLPVVQSPPGVTTVLRETMSPENRFFLERWEKEMIKELGVQGFQKYKRDTFQRGTDMHLCIEQYLKGKRGSDLPVVPSMEKFWQSIQGVLPDISDVQFLEQSVKHPHLHYRGIVDCIAKYRGKLCVIDWKTSKKKKSNIKYTFDNPVQLAAYIGAVNFDETFPTPIEQCLLVIAYEDGSDGHAHLMTREQCLQYWGEWLQRLHLYWCIKTSQQAAA